MRFSSSGTRSASDLSRAARTGAGTSASGARLHDLLDIGEQRRETALPRRRRADRLAERLLGRDDAADLRLLAMPRLRARS